MTLHGCDVNGPTCILFIFSVSSKRDLFFVFVGMSGSGWISHGWFCDPTDKSMLADFPIVPNESNIIGTHLKCPLWVRCRLFLFCFCAPNAETMPAPPFPLPVSNVCSASVTHYWLIDSVLSLWVHFLTSTPFLLSSLLFSFFLFSPHLTTHFLLFPLFNNSSLPFCPSPNNNKECHHTHRTQMNIRQWPDSVNTSASTPVNPPPTMPAPQPSSSARHRRLTCPTGLSRYISFF